ncbi:MAG: hypothetical protein FWE36_07800 [Erysipelotrichales bacterium]|nr:hypothetical protein [Erysipelotrichales bacterium]
MFNKKLEIQLSILVSEKPSFTSRLLAIHEHRKQTSALFTKMWIILCVPIMWTLLIFAAFENLIEAIMSLPFIFVASLIVTLSCFSLWGKFISFALRKNLVGGSSLSDARHNRRVAESILPELEQIDSDSKKRSNVIFVKPAPRKGPGSFGNIFTSVLVIGLIFTLAGIAPIIFSIMEHGWTGFYLVYIDNPIFIFLILFLFLGTLLIGTTLYNALWAMKIKKRTNALFADVKNS